MRTLRLLGVGWLYHMRMISRSPFEGFGQVLWPLFFATVAFLVFRAGHSPRTLLYASLGSAVTSETYASSSVGSRDATRPTSIPSSWASSGAVSSRSPVVWTISS